MILIIFQILSNQLQISKQDPINYFQNPPHHDFYPPHFMEANGNHANEVANFYYDNEHFIHDNNRISLKLAEKCQCSCKKCDDPQPCCTEICGKCVVTPMTMIIPPPPAVIVELPDTSEESYEDTTTTTEKTTKKSTTTTKKPTTTTKKPTTTTKKPTTTTKKPTTTTKKTTTTKTTTTTTETTTNEYTTTTDTTTVEPETQPPKIRIQTLSTMPFICYGEHCTNPPHRRHCPKTGMKCLPRKFLQINHGERLKLRRTLPVTSAKRKTTKTTFFLDAIKRNWDDPNQNLILAPESIFKEVLEDEQRKETRLSDTDVVTTNYWNEIIKNWNEPNNLIPVPESIIKEVQEDEIRKKTVTTDFWNIMNTNWNDPSNLILDPETVIKEVQEDEIKKKIMKAKAVTTDFWKIVKTNWNDPNHNIAPESIVEEILEDETRREISTTKTRTTGAEKRKDMRKSEWNNLKAQTILLVPQSIIKDVQENGL